MTEPRLNFVHCPHAHGVHRMAYWEWGHPQSPHVLLCLHGLARQGRDFDVLARAMSVSTLAGGQTNYRVVCPDVVGRGLSDPLPDPQAYVLPTYITDMITLTASLNVQTKLQTLDFVGTSMGGLIGLALAALPNTPVRRLVLNDVGPEIQFAAIERIGAYLGIPLHWPSVEAAADYLRKISRGFGPHTTEQWLALSRPMLKAAAGGYTLHYDPRIALPFKSVTTEMAGAAQALTWAAFDAIRCPTLLLRGAESDLLSADTAHTMTQRGPRPKLHEFAGVGHAPTLMADDQVAVVREFLLAP
jgi:pimeloyl-ACP methyl ester carboxylesterase